MARFTIGNRKNHCLDKTGLGATIIEEQMFVFGTQEQAEDFLAEHYESIRSVLGKNVKVYGDVFL